MDASTPKTAGRSASPDEWIRPADQRTAGWLLCLLLVGAAIPVAVRVVNGQLIPFGQRQPFPSLMVDVNQASQVELSLLPGIGPGLADRIVRRRAVEPFRYVEELRQIKGIGPKTLDRLRGVVRCGTQSPTPEGAS